MLQNLHHTLYFVKKKVQRTPVDWIKQKSGLRDQHSANANKKEKRVREHTHSIHFVVALLVAAGVVGIKWKVKSSATVGFITRVFTVRWRCEGEMWDAGTVEQSGAVGLSSETVTHFMELNTEQYGWRQTLRRAAGY